MLIKLSYFCPSGFKYPSCPFKAVTPEKGKEAESKGSTRAHILKKQNQKIIGIPHTELFKTYTEISKHQFVIVCMSNAYKLTLEVRCDFHIAQSYRQLIEPCAKFSEFLMCSVASTADHAMVVEVLCTKSCHF